MITIGSKVKTNEAYSEKFNRLVHGYIYEIDETKRYAIVIWEEQEGNIIPEHQDQKVLMLVRDLEEI